MNTDSKLPDTTMRINEPNGTCAASDAHVEFASNQAAAAIPPLWPLASSVAVNPFLGQRGEPLFQTAARLARVGGIKVTPSREYFQRQMHNGVITDADLASALADVAGLATEHTMTPDSLREVLACKPEEREALRTMADLAALHTGTDWPALLTQRFGAWAGGYFDKGQALWSAPKGRGAYMAWRETGVHDLTLEIAGLSGFARHVAEAPETAAGMRARAVITLSLSETALETYLHALLFRLGGWAQYARYLAWQADLAGTTDSTLTDLLAIALLHEEALFLHTRKLAERDWQALVKVYAEPLKPHPDQIVDAVLQEANERAVQRQLTSQLLDREILAVTARDMAHPAQQQHDLTDSDDDPGAVTRTANHQKEGRPRLQAAFCIDVRSEVFRRALESIDGDIVTLGFAGFFGISTAHRRAASDVAENRHPVLLNPNLYSTACTPETFDADQAMRISARSIRAWQRFKAAAISSFSFVDATGPIYLAKLLRDSLGWSAPCEVDKQVPQLDPLPDVESRVAAARQVLHAMSLTDVFAPVVLLLGHGARVTNNAHASGLQCGACGGYSGEVNARLLAALLNDPEVRARLARSEGPFIPEDTVFVAGLHDTTNDSVQLFADDNQRRTPEQTLDQVKRWLDKAGYLARTERAARLPHAVGEHTLQARSRDWSEVRPEWALADCQAFIAAPRTRTQGLDLGGRAFLHEYRWQQDKDFAILELIMTAPVVVASWINLQYYGSLVAPDAFGAGNKLLHNVTGGIGVVEGNGGNLRAGLPWQSIHDGEHARHQPLRLAVYVEAPVAALNRILENHSQVRELFDNRWLSLIALASDGRGALRYKANLVWE